MWDSKYRPSSCFRHMCMLVEIEQKKSAWIWFLQLQWKHMNATSSTSMCEVAMAKLTACHANSCIYMLTQEKEFGLLCTNFTVHNSISNYDCFIILKYGFLIHMMETILTRICQSSQIAVSSICKSATLFVLSFGFYIACLKWWRAKGLYRSESSSDPHILASFFTCVDMGPYPLEGKELSWNDSVPSAC